MMCDEAREEDAGGMFRPKEKNSRCRVLQNVTEAWATGSPGFCGREVTERDGRSCCRSVSGDMNGVWERTWDALGKNR